MSSPKRLARIAGLLYVINAIVAGFAFGFVATKMYAAGDAATTAANVVANPGLVRVGVVADLFQATEWVFLAMALYLLLRHVSTDAARAMVVLVAIGAGITCLNDVFEFVAVRVATDAVVRGRLRRRGLERPRAAPVRPPALRLPHRPDLLRPVAGAARVSRLPVGDVPQGAGRRAHRGGRLLPGGHARAVPGPRPRQADQRRPRHPADDRRSGWPCTCSSRGCGLHTPERAPVVAAEQVTVTA